jgi:sortase (surface protein transpeptidase)
LPERAPRWVLRTMEALSGGLLFTALIGATVGGAAPGPPPGPVRTPAGTPAGTPDHGGGQPPDAHAPLAPSTPLAIAVPSIAVAAPLLSLGTDRTGQPELPPFSMPDTAGWLRDSATPGSAGAAVVAGHVDTATGPAVFWSLSAVRPGATVDITRLDGSTAVFTVDRVRAYARADFPAPDVYGPTSVAALRLITCGGAYDRARHHYTGNVVVFAHLTAVDPAPSGEE